MAVSATPITPDKKPVRRRSLVQIVVIVMIILSLLPIVIVGAAASLRSNDVVREQTAIELTNAGKIINKQLNSSIERENKALDDILSQPGVDKDIELILSEARYDPSFTISFLRVNGYFTSFSADEQENIFSRVYLVDTSGKIHLSSDLTNINTNVADDPAFKAVLGKDSTLLWYNAAPFFPNKFAIINSRVIKSDSGSPIATIIGFATPNNLVNLLSTTSVFSPFARAYYLTANNLIITSDNETNRIVQLSMQPDQKEKLLQTVKKYPEGGTTSFISNRGEPVIAFAQWFENSGSGFVIEIPEVDALSQIQIFTSYNITLLLIILFVAGLIVYLGALQLVTPINKLSEHALAFARGDFSQRADDERPDELGLLGESFNHMVEEITTLYRSLEQKVEERTTQMRTASEVAQVAISGSNRDDILDKTVQLITERFNLDYAALYLLDEAGTSAVLKKASKLGVEELVFREIRIPLISNNIIGWVASNSKPRMINNVSEEQSSTENLLPETKSEVAVPIMLGTQVLGVLDIQSSQLNAFDPEALNVFRTLTNQLAIGLRNVLLLESTEVNLQETSLLYRASRQITQTKDDIEIAEVLSNTLAQTNYVSFLLAIEQDHLRLLTLTDSRGGKNDSGYKGIRLPLQRGSTVLKEGNIILINDLKASSEFDNLLSFFDRRGCTSAALVPILEGGKPTKILALGSRQTAPINMTALQPFANLAEVVGTTYERFSVLQNLQLRLNELQTLASFSEAISAETVLDDLYKTLHKKVTETVGEDIGFILAMFNSRTEMIEIPVIFDNNETLKIDPFPLGEGLTSYVIKTGKSLLLSNDVENAAKELGAKIVGKPAKSWLGVPLVIGGDVIGAVIIQDTQKEERFSESDLALFNTLAPQIATSIRNAQLLKEMQEALNAYDQERFLLNSLLDSTPDHIFFKDVDGAYLRVSNSMVDSLGLTTGADLIGHNDYELFGEEIGEAAYQELEILFQNGKPKEEIVETRTEDGNISNWTQSNSIPLYDKNEQPYGLLGIQRDITEVKKAENLAQRRAQQLRTAAEIARDTTGTLNLAEILQKSVNLVRERYGFYHSSVFLLDAIKEYAVLEESTGDAGEKMKQTGHKLAVGSKSIVGRVTASGEPLVVNDVHQDPSYYPNPLLPETQSELAIPMRVGEQVLGALDVQSRYVNAFSDEDVNTLQILADQIALAVVNANLFTKTQEQITKH
ncbi:MAG: GAF domain-containing protein, partial [Anaerolineaceae bacterium]|nr:GAF domain-containing protein [Anaerolineaceae bacterium]